AFADQAQGEVRERGEIAAGADRAFLWHDWADATVKHFTKHLDDLETDSTQTEGEHIRSQQHHRAHFRFRKRIADAAGVAANKVELELAQAFGPVRKIGRLAKPRPDTKHHGSAHNDSFNHLAGTKIS